MCLQKADSMLYQTLDSVPSTSTGASTSFVNPAYPNKTAHGNNVQKQVWPLAQFYSVCYLCKWKKYLPGGQFNDSWSKQASTWLSFQQVNSSQPSPQSSFWGVIGPFMGLQPRYATLNSLIEKSQQNRIKWSRDQTCSNGNVESG